MVDEDLLEDLNDISELSRTVRTCSDLSVGEGRLSARATAMRKRIRNNLINVLDLAALHLLRSAGGDTGLFADDNVAAIVEQDLAIVRYAAEAGETEEIRGLARRCLDITEPFLAACSERFA